MKLALLMSLTLMSFAASAGPVNSAKIAKAVSIICKNANNCETYAAQGKTAKEIVQNLIRTIDEEDPADRYVELKDGKTPDVDDVVWGTLTMKGALNMVDAEYMTPAKARAIENQIRSLVGTGVEFGYTPSTGGSACGIVWPGLLIIDTATKKAVDVQMGPNGEC